MLPWAWLFLLAPASLALFAVHVTSAIYHVKLGCHQALRVSMEEQRARQEKDAREAVTASVTESTNLSTGEKGF